MDMDNIYDFIVETIEGEQISLKKYEGMVMLIVNTASKCGFTYQYEGLQKLYERYRDKGFMILGFPCNQFLNQEPGDEEEIKNFCSLNYNVTFPMFKKIKVNGPDTIPLYKFLKNRTRGFLGRKKIPWNFTKFIVSKDGKQIKRFPPTKKPEELQKIIEDLLK